MLFVLKKNHSLTCKEKVLGVDNENKSEVIEVLIEDDSLLEKWAYLEFKLPNEVTFLTPRLDIVDKKITYVVPNSLMKNGYLRVQVSFRDSSEWVYKSFVSIVTVKYSINADKEVEVNNPDFISEAQAILDEAKEVVVEVENKVDKSTKINNHTLETDVVLNSSDIGTYSKEEIDANRISDHEIDLIVGF